MPNDGSKSHLCTKKPQLFRLLLRIVNEILSDTNTRLWQIDVLIGKLLTKCLSKPVILNLERLNILKKHRTTKKFCILSEKIDFAFY